MINFSFKKIWHLANKQTRVVQLMVVKAVEEWMVKVQQTLIITLVHIRQLKTKPGGEWTWEKWNLLLKCTLSTETCWEADCQILKSELVGYYLLHHLLVHSYTPIHVNVQDQWSIVIATTSSKKIKGNLQVYMHGFILTKYK